MIIKIRVRRNDVAESQVDSRQDDEFQVFDNAQNVKFSPTPTKVDRKAFSEFRNAAKTTDHLHKILRNPSAMMKDKDEFHYSIITFTDRVTNQTHEVRFDTIAFLMNDQGQTLDKIKG